MVRLLTAGIFLGCCSPLSAQVFTGPSSTWTESVVDNNAFGQQIDGTSSLDPTSPGTISYSNLIDDTQLVASVLTSGGSQPIADVQGHIDGHVDLNNLNGGPTELNAPANIRYSFMVTPLDFSTPDHGPIPLRVISRGQASWDIPEFTFPNGNVTAEARLTVDGGRLADASVDFDADYNTPTAEFDVDILTSAFVGSEHTIELLATGDAFLENTEFSQTSEFQAVVDPQIFIDPSFPYANLYSIHFNTPYVTQVPEPSSLGLLVAAGAVVAAARQWRRRGSYRQSR